MAKTPSHPDKGASRPLGQKVGQKSAPKAASQQTRGASTHSLGLLDRLRSASAHHRVTFVKTLRDLLSAWITSLMTWLVIGIALALPMFLHLLLANSTSIGEGFDGTAKVNVYLSSDARVSELTQSLNELPEVQSSTVILADDALLDFQQQTGFTKILSSLPSNPLPNVIELKPADISAAQMRLMTTKLEAWNGVDRVAVDLEWLERLQALLSLGERFVFTLATFLGLGVILAIGNTIRLAIENRRSEIEVIKLVGATDAFVRRPFLYLGFWYGFGGALIAWVLVQSSFLILSAPIEQLLISYQNSFDLRGVGLGETLFMFTVGISLGMGGAAIAVSRHLHTIEPS